MFSVVSAFLLVARIDGQPESEGSLSLMQYAAQSEFEAVTGTDEEFACKDFCSKKSQCTWFTCKGCSFCPKETEGCKSFCSTKSHCTWGACKGCSFCPKETEGCKSWCSAHASPWSEKCKLNTCKGCEPCPEPTPARADCKPWCKPNTSPWGQKCKLDACKGCEPCPEQTRPRPRPRPTPTASPTPAPTEPPVLACRTLVGFNYANCDGTYYGYEGGDVWTQQDGDGRHVCLSSGKCYPKEVDGCPVKGHFGERDAAFWQNNFRPCSGCMSLTGFNYAGCDGTYYGSGDVWTQSSGYGRHICLSSQKCYPKEVDGCPVKGHFGERDFDFWLNHYRPC